MADTLAWGIIGAGHIAAVFAEAVARSTRCRVAAVGSLRPGVAAEFGRKFNIPACYESYDAVLADRDVQAVYIATRQPDHVEWAINAARAGKHLLVEKPIGMNAREARAMIDAARDNDVFLMEAFVYRGHPQTQRWAELLRDKAIGEVRLIRASFVCHFPFDPASRIYDKAKGGGAILDIGCYCTSGVKLAAAAALGQDVAEPLRMQALGTIGSTGIDERSAAQYEFEGGLLAQVWCGLSAWRTVGLEILGTAGSLSIPVPWGPCRRGGSTTILLDRNGQQEQIAIATDTYAFTYEADQVAQYLSQRQSPHMTWADTLGNMKMLDEWRAAIGLTYDADKA